MVFPLIISQILKLVSQHFLSNRPPKAAQNEDTGGQMQNESLLGLFNRLTTTQQHHLAKSVLNSLRRAGDQCHKRRSGDS